MRELICTEDEAWPGIIAALAKAQPGDVVRLRPGRYTGSETLFIPSGVRLAGAPGVCLSFEADAPAVRFRDVEGSSLADVKIEMVAAHVARRSHADDPASEEDVRIEWGLIWAERSRGIHISSVEITSPPGGHEYLNAIAIWASHGCIVSECCISFLGRNGILLVSSEASIRTTQISGMHKHGLFLGRGLRSPDQPSRARVEQNRCHDNGQSGIALSSSEAEAIADNECWGNQHSGIVLARDPNSPDQPSRAGIERNRCHDNSQAGIALLSSEAEAIAENECWGNQFNGIVLLRDNESPDQPSRARVEHNRCHDNGQSGIGLSSSEADAIADNECWGNQHSGIALQRDDKSPDQPSRARLEHNRCQDNGQAGIVLSSCEAEAIADNECWGNRNAGIALQRDAKSPDQPSRARLKHNRCHDNSQAGIMLSSSEAEALADNECWGNQRDGIVLLRDDKSPDHPSRARLEHNRCHDNGQAGIALFSSEAGAIAENECWGNQRDGIALLRDDRSPDQPSRARVSGNLCDHNAGAGLTLLGSDIIGLERNRVWENVNRSLIPRPDAPDIPWTPPESALATSPDPEAVARRRLRSRGGALEMRLMQAGCAEPDALARFATGPGCIGCLLAAWRSNVAAPSSQQSKIHKDRPGEGRLYRLVSDTPADKVVFEPGPRASLTDQVWHFARRNASAPKASVRVIGVLGGPRDGLLDALARDVRLLRGAERGDENKLLAESKICYSAFKAFERQGRRIGMPLDVDCALRGALEMAGANAEHPLFQRETLGATARWRARLGLLLRPLQLLFLTMAVAAFLLVLAALGQVKGYDGDIRNVSGAVCHYIRTTIIGSQISDWKHLVAIAAFVPAALVYLCNLFLPRILRLRLPALLHDLARRFLGLERWFAEGNDSKVALRWVRRRLFGKDSSQGFALLVLRHPDLWSSDDLDRLRALLEKRPEGQGLAIIVPLQNATQILSGLLLPWVDPVTRRPRPGPAADIELLLLPETPALHEATPRIMDPLRLLGVEVSGVSEADMRKSIYAGLRDDRLTINDLVPLLVFGSAPQSPMVIVYDQQNTSPSLNNAIAPYAQFAPNDPNKALISFEPKDADSWVTRSACTLLHSEAVGQRTNRHLIGRGAYREDLTAALRPVFVAMGRDFDVYSRVLAGCGQLFNLLEVARLLGFESVSHDRLAKIVRHLRAAAVLAQTGPPFEDGSHRQERIVRAWNEIAERLPAAVIDDEASVRTLAVEVIGLAFGAAAPVPVVGGSRLLALIGSPGGAAGGQERRTLQEIVGDEVERVLSALSELDQDYGSRLLDRQLNGSWQSIATICRASLYQRLEVARATKRPLAERLAHAASYEDFATLLRGHRGDLPRFMALCYCTAARSTTDFGEQQRLAETMLTHRATGLQISAHIAINPINGPGMIIDYLADPRTADIIRPAVRTPAAEEDIEEYVYLDSFDRASAEIDNIVTILLSGHREHALSV